MSNCLDGIFTPSDLFMLLVFLAFLFTIYSLLCGPYQNLQPFCVRLFMGCSKLSLSHWKMKERLMQWRIQRGFRGFV